MINLSKFNNIYSQNPNIYTNHIITPITGLGVEASKYPAINDGLYRDMKPSNDIYQNILKFTEVSTLHARCFTIYFNTLYETDAESRAKQKNFLIQRLINFHYVINQQENVRKQTKLWQEYLCHGTIT